MRPAPRALVSVITPTWQRAALLADTIENVRAQTYRPLEHIIVSDGLDLDAFDVVADLDLAAIRAGSRSTDVRIDFVELGRNWTSFLPDSFCAAPMLVGMLVAGGTYQTWCADDERMTPDHIETLVEALESTGGPERQPKDFAYGKVRMHRVGQAPEHGWDIGTDPPRIGQITNVLYRVDLLKRGLYPCGEGMISDWACIENWIEQGATWAFVDRVTLTHRVDH